jgi:hypothetical protein
LQLGAAAGGLPKPYWCYMRCVGGVHTCFDYLDSISFPKFWFDI